MAWNCCGRAFSATSFVPTTTFPIWQPAAPCCPWLGCTSYARPRAGSTSDAVARECIEVLSDAARTTPRAQQRQPASGARPQHRHCRSQRCGQVDDDPAPGRRGASDLRTDPAHDAGVLAARLRWRVPGPPDWSGQSEIRLADLWRRLPAPDPVRRGVYRARRLLPRAALLLLNGHDDPPRLCAF